MRKLLTVVSIAFSFIAQAQISTLYVGGYTNEKSEGIYTFQFNSETGSLKNKVLVAQTNNPSYLVTSSNIVFFIFSSSIKLIFFQKVLSSFYKKLLTYMKNITCYPVQRNSC